jgi:hypothetical protein
MIKRAMILAAGFGQSSVNGCNRLPKPAARIIALLIIFFYNKY